MLRIMQATVTPEPKPNWSIPGSALITQAYAPWGDLVDLAYADTKHPIVSRLLKSKAIPALWQTVLKHWFNSRLHQSPLPAPSPLWHNQPLWHSKYLPIYRIAVVRTLTWHTRYTRTMATLGYTKVLHVYNSMKTAGDEDTTSQHQAHMLVRIVHNKC